MVARPPAAGLLHKVPRWTRTEPCDRAKSVLNRYPRYLSLVRFLASHPNLTILEIGSGSLGLAEFWNRPFVGCDPRFRDPPHPNLTAVAASGEELPFASGVFDLVVCQDTLEHLSPDRRADLIREAGRVSRRFVYVSFPRGRGAVLADRLYAFFLLRLRRMPLPEWLEDHLTLPPVDPRTIRSALEPDGFVTMHRNENLLIHLILLILEHWTSLNRRALGFARGCPRATRRIFGLANLPPAYRTVMILDKSP